MPATTGNRSLKPGLLDCVLQEDHFSVYEPYCANLTAAQDLAIAENASLTVSQYDLSIADTAIDGIGLL